MGFVVDQGLTWHEAFSTWLDKFCRVIFDDEDTKGIYVFLHKQEIERPSPQPNFLGEKKIAVFVLLSSDPVSIQLHVKHSIICHLHVWRRKQMDPK